MSLSQDTRTHVVGELYDTERSYVESLQILVEKYMKPLKSLESNRVLIDSALVDEIFFTIPEILQHHESFLSALQDRLSSDWDTSQVIGNVFIEAFTNQQIIDTYTAFINNWKNARHAIKVATQAKPAFERYLEAMSREHRNKLTLDALLIMPVQRIPRYELLIKELIKHTPEQHPDFLPLMEAQKEIHELALKIDRAEKEMMQQEQLKELELLIEGHAELQQPQRDFIRYDLVTMLGSSALTVAKKERVLFLFCDLLIMTSVKKKASRRSNLQSAFANSSNDLSLLEGTKFKLLLRAPLDQLEVRADAQLLQHATAQQQHHQLGLKLKHQSRQLEERRRQLEAELCALRQMETLGAKLSLVDANKLNEQINELANQLSKRLISLEQGAELEQPAAAGGQQQQQQQQQQQAALLSQAQELHAANLCASPAHLSATASSGQLSGAAQTQSAHQSAAGAAAASSQPECAAANASLELVIGAAGPALTQAGPMTSELAAAAELAASCGEAQASAGESLVVTFGSPERRQAFLAAFLEAKQQRYQLQQQRHQQQNQRIYSSSITLRLAQPDAAADASARRSLEPAGSCEAGGQQQQQRAGSASLAEQPQLGQAAASAGHAQPAAMVHQMSAPQPLAELAEPELLCAACAAPANCQRPKQLGQQHHHHQLMHQPASQPARLHTICCQEPHNDARDSAPNDGRRGESRALSGDSSEPNNAASALQFQDFYEQLKRQLAANSSVVGLQAERAGPLGWAALNQTSLLIKSAPKFHLALPVNFLSTQHPALQFTCSTQRQADFQGDFAEASADQTAEPQVRRQQRVRDNAGQLWLCMSNGYVSHVALISLRRQRLGPDENCAEARRCFKLLPALHSAGDICKSHINCARQVRCPKRRARQPRAPDNRADLPQDHAHAQAPQRATVEVAVKAASPPIDIKQMAAAAAAASESAGRSVNSAEEAAAQVRLSASAPTAQAADRNEKSDPHSSSATRLELPTPRAARQPISAPSSAVAKRWPPAESSGCQRHRGAHSRPPTRSHHSHSHSHAHHAHHHHHHAHHHHTHHHHHAHLPLCPSPNAHHAGHQHQHLVYGARHNTVPITELRRALERQSRISEAGFCRAGHQLAPPAAAAAAAGNLPQAARLDFLSASGHAPKWKGQRATTPPACLSGGKSFRSARLLRHQASLKTSSILAKLVGGASRHSARLRASRSSQSSQERQRSDTDDTDTDNNGGAAHLRDSRRSDELLRGPRARRFLTASSCEAANALVSPLSSASSLNSTNSSMAVNSACASSPDRSACDLLAHSASASSCCAAGHAPCNVDEPAEAAAVEEQRLRARSATVPCRPLCRLPPDLRHCSPVLLQRARPALSVDAPDAPSGYKVSEILEAAREAPGRGEEAPPFEEARSVFESSLWLGCDDGTLIVIHCLSEPSANSDEQSAEPHASPDCDNAHSEVQLGASICDISSWHESLVFVALSNGQLAIFSRQDDEWAVTKPRLLRVTENELQATSKLCLVDDAFLWYSYGRNIFVLRLATLQLESTIVAPTNDPTLQFSVQSVAIENMALMERLAGVWVSFRNSHLIQLYDVRGHKLLLELSLAEAVNKMLSHGNEIVRQHKTAALKATALLSYENQRDNCTTLFVGTSAGLILYLSIARDQLPGDDLASVAELELQLASLRHGHSGQVRLLHLVELAELEGRAQADSDAAQAAGAAPEEREIFLVSGGAGVDLYGPLRNAQEQQSQSSAANFLQTNNEADNLNHLMLWQL